VINTSFVVHGDEASGEGSFGSIRFLHNFAPAKRLTTLSLRRYASHHQNLCVLSSCRLSLRL